MHGKLQSPPRRTVLTTLVTAAVAAGTLGLLGAQSYAQPVPSTVAAVTTSQPRIGGEDESIRPFHISFPEATLADLRQRVAATRWPERETVTDRSQGVQLATMKELATIGRRITTGERWRRG